MPTDKIKRMAGKKMDDIIRAAVTEFAKNSFEEASYNKIIKNAKIGKGTMYYYFQSKEDLFNTILSGTLQGIKSTLDPLPEPSEKEAYWSDLESLIERFFLFAKAQPLVFRLLIKNIHPSFAKGPTSKVLGSLDGWLLNYLEKGQRLGAIRGDLPCSLLGKVVWSTFDAATGWLMNMEDTKPIENTALLIDLLSRGLCPPSSSVAENLPQLP